MALVWLVVKRDAMLAIVEMEDGAGEEEKEPGVWIWVFEAPALTLRVKKSYDGELPKHPRYPQPAIRHDFLKNFLAGIRQVARCLRQREGLGEQW